MWFLIYVHMGMMRANGIPHTAYDVIATYSTQDACEDKATAMRGKYSHGMKTAYYYCSDKTPVALVIPTKKQKAKWEANAANVDSVP